MDKTLIAVGLMSGTSMDGIDASIIRSNGEENIDIIGNLYLKYDSELKSSLQQFCKKILSRNDLKDNLDQYNILEREITIKHAKLVNQICKKFNSKPNIIGFHGQTILHKPEENYSIQIGNAKLLSQLSSTDVIYQFRKNDSLADTELNYKVFMPGHMLGYDCSIVEKLQAHQDNIDLYKYKIQLAIGRDKGKVYTIDTSQLDGVNDINEIATIAQTVGIIPYNSYNDETGMSKPSGKYFDVIDLKIIFFFS